MVLLMPVGVGRSTNPIYFVRHGVNSDHGCTSTVHNWVGFHLLPDACLQPNSTIITTRPMVCTGAQEHIMDLSYLQHTNSHRLQLLASNSAVHLRKEPISLHVGEE